MKEPTLLTFCALPKVHKSSKTTGTEQTSRVVDAYLHPHVTALPSYMRDTPDLLKIVDGLSISPGAWLIVEALYSSIPHDRGLVTVKEFLRERSNRKWVYSEFILKILEYIWTHNIFTFLGSYFLQVQGVAMGTCCAPSYANLYLGGVGA